MIKSIYQYRYFGEDYSKIEYIPIQFSATDLTLIEAEFTQRVKDGEIYIQVVENGAINYAKVNDSERYNSKNTYYEIYSNSNINYPETLTKNNLSSGSAFEKHIPIVKLGIQSLPGIKFQINSNTNWIVIGMTGIYELDLTQSSGVINKLRFDSASLDVINTHENAYLIIDIMSELEG